MITRFNSIVPIFSIVFFLFFTIEVKAQAYRVEVDSILKQAKIESTQEKQVIMQLAAVKAYSSYSVDSCIVLIDSLLSEFQMEKSDFAIARAKSLKAWYISYQTRYEEGLKLAHEAMLIQEKSKKDSLGLAKTYLRLALLYVHFEKYKESEVYFEKAEKYFENLHDTAGLDMVYNNKGAMLSSINANQAIEYYQRSLNLRKQLKDYDFWIAYSYYNIGSSYLDLAQFDSAYRYLNLSEYTFKNEAKREVPPMVVLGLGHYYYEIKDYQKAETYCRKALNLASERNHTEIILESNFLLAETLNKLGKSAEAYAILKNYQDLKNDFDSLNNAAQVAEYELKYNSAKKEEKIAKLESDRIIQESDLKQARFTSVLIIILALLVVLTGVFFFNRRQQKQKLHASKLEASLAELRLVALRAQMNPHFIFNCINTAQYFVISAEKEAAYDYLANFAKLLRLVLENSGKTFVTLEDELKQLQLYIDLELIRFSDKFSYSISVDPALENGIYEVPAMILQPFIENAILHGIMNKEDNALGQLSIDLILKEDSIQCTIIDNGIGRLKAQEIKQQKTLHYQATALPNIQERLSILNRGSQRKIHYQIEDISFSEEPGTRVVIDLPFQ